ncbi:twin transmembrane helix small protein [Sphingomonas sp. HITSZ_GF]|uniref:twin transmembrane helix small protein n=1 Tax=Sphingomonas sp. HITSZ_GF TaxID=3037247 RepID=UPI00240DE981|nr:twin transmembrane helix small protein [Sphingomonas sp. HITSZ_GF]MDG2534543.1 twin transmembrane helix small protein [Sphingomonas sp. HITSZ_GF]
MFFLAILLLAAMFATLFILIRGLVNMAGTTSQDLEAQGDGPSPRALKSQKLMQQRILFQAVAIGVAAIILFALSAKG